MFEAVDGTITEGSLAGECSKWLMNEEEKLLRWHVIYEAREGGVALLVPHQE